MAEQKSLKQKAREAIRDFISRKGPRPCETVWRLATLSPAHSQQDVMLLMNEMIREGELVLNEDLDLELAPESPLRIGIHVRNVHTGDHGRVLNHVPRYGPNSYLVAFPGERAWVKREDIEPLAEESGPAEPYPAGTKLVCTVAHNNGRVPKGASAEVVYAYVRERQRAVCVESMDETVYTTEELRRWFKYAEGQ